MIQEIKICKRCLYSNHHPLGITFNEEGICSGCEIFEEKNILDWNHRWQLLKKTIKNYKSKSGKNYDCIVPVTGGNDSYYVVHLVKNKLKLNPLLVSYNKYFNTPLGIRNLSNLRIKFDVDIIYQNVNPEKIKKITRNTLNDHKSIYWPILAGGTVFPVQTAVNFKIPLIIWGAHQGVEQVGMYSHEQEVEMTRRYREDHDLFMKDEEEILNLENNLDAGDLWQFKYPSDYSLNSIGVRGIYLSNFVRWDPVAQHIQMIKNFDYKSSKFSRTFDTYDHVDCYNYMNLHDYLKLLKHGYSKVTDHACREIRHKRISREEGVALVKKYELIKPDYLNLFADWLGIDLPSLEMVINKSRNPKFWIETDLNKFEFKGLSDHFKNETKNKSNLDNYFINNSEISMKKNPGYITFGKGFNEY